MPEAGTVRLHDIHGLDPVGIWPLAPGWWMLIGAVLLLWGLRLLVRIVWRRRRGQRSQRWRRDAARQLAALRARVRGGDEAKAIAADLSELLRRIAIARCGREACAGLSGEAWLEWLSARDPRRFDWRSHGRLLAGLAYGPPGADDHAAALQEMLDAALAWVAQGADCVARPGRSA